MIRPIMKSDSLFNYSRPVLTAAAAIVLAVLLAWHSAAGKALLARGLETFAQLTLANEWAAKALFVGLAGVSAMVAPFSSVALTPFAVSVWGSSLTVALLLSGWLLGGIVSFALAYYAGFPLVQRLLGRERLIYYQQRISARTAFRWVLLFRLAMPSETASYLLGMLRYDPGKYLAATLLTELPVALIVVYASHAFLDERKLVFFALAALVLLALWLAARALDRARLRDAGDDTQ